MPWPPGHGSDNPNSPHFRYETVQSVPPVERCPDPPEQDNPVPELPEVETMVRGIARHVTGRRLLSTRRYPCRFRPIELTPSSKVIRRRIEGAVISASRATSTLRTPRTPRRYTTKPSTGSRDARCGTCTGHGGATSRLRTESLLGQTRSTGSTVQSPQSAKAVGPTAPASYCIGGADTGKEPCISNSFY